jgi:nitrogen regulatory protein P-II 1
MKKVEAIIQPFKLIDVKQALTEIGVMTLAVSELQEADPGEHHTEIYRGLEYTVDFTPRVKLEIVVSDWRADQAIAVIAEAAKTGHDTSGTIFISSLEDAVKIETGKHGDDFI